MSRIAAVIGARVREARLAKGWSQSELARRVGTQRPNISRLERASGDHCPTIPFLWAVTSALDMTLSDLLLGVETLTVTPRTTTPKPVAEPPLYSRRLRGLTYSVARSAVGVYRDDHREVRVAVVEVSPFAAGRPSVSIMSEMVRVVDGALADAYVSLPAEVTDDVRRMLMRGRVAA